MKITFLITLFLFSVIANGQNLKNLINQGTTQVKNIVNQNPTSAQLSNTDIVGGLKEALTLGAQKSASKLSAFKIISRFEK